MNQAQAQHSNKPAATRARRSRARKNQGLASIRVDVHQDDLAPALITSTRLSPDETLDPDKVRRALEQIVADFVRRWTHV